MSAITPEQLRTLATQYHVDPRALQAIIAVESGGSGFLPDGRCKILFERHIMYQRLQTPDRQIDPRPFSAAHPELCGPKWDPQHYPYGTEAHQWDRLSTVVAYAQNHDPAHVESYRKASYEACSWGLFQLMGEHYPAVGYPDVLPFVAAMQASELNQLGAILIWMRGNGLLTHLQAQDWRGFAAGYNGMGQVAAYADRLRTAFSRAQG